METALLIDSTIRSQPLTRAEVDSKDTSFNDMDLNSPLFVCVLGPLYYNQSSVVYLLCLATSHISIGSVFQGLRQSFFFLCGRIWFLSNHWPWLLWARLILKLPWVRLKRCNKVHKLTALSYITVSCRASTLLTSVMAATAVRSLLKKRVRPTCGHVAPRLRPTSLQSDNSGNLLHRQIPYFIVTWVIYYT